MKTKKITITITKKPGPLAGQAGPLAGQAGPPSKSEINKHIRDHKLQTAQRMYVVIDEYLSKLCNFDVDSVHKIDTIHKSCSAN